LRPFLNRFFLEKVVKKNERFFSVDQWSDNAADEMIRKGKFAVS
jgi:hypothetical protein